MCIWESRKLGAGGAGGWPLSFIFYFPSLPLSLSLISLSLAFLLSCAAHLYPPALRGGRLLGFEFFPPNLILKFLFLASFFHFLLIHHPPSDIIIIIITNIIIIIIIFISEDILVGR